MAKEKIKKIVGVVSSEIAEKYNLKEYENQEIIQSLDLYKHIHKHIDEFDSVDSYNHAILNVDKIISDPYFVYYEEERNSLLYYKEIDEYVCVVVKLKLRKNKENYIATIYPCTKSKIEKLKQKDLVNQFTYKGNSFQIC